MEKKGKKGAIFMVYFDMNGDVCDVELTPEGKERGCGIREEGQKLMNPEAIREIICEHSKVEVKSHSVIIASGSPDCIIYLNKYPICICCPWPPQ